MSVLLMGWFWNRRHYDTCYENRWWKQRKKVKLKLTANDSVYAQAA